MMGQQAWEWPVGTWADLEACGEGGWEEGSGWWVEGCGWRVVVVVVVGSRRRGGGTRFGMEVAGAWGYITLHTKSVI
jgi:hypothetical protein